MSAEKEVKPTEGALRAANIIVSNIATYNELRDIEIMQPPIDKVAECIDRETGTPDLLAACESAQQAFSWAEKAGTDRERTAFSKLRDALSRAKGEQSK